MAEAVQQVPLPIRVANQLADAVEICRRTNSLTTVIEVSDPAVARALTDGVATKAYSYVSDLGEQKFAVSLPTPNTV